MRAVNLKAKRQGWIALGAMTALAALLFYFAFGFSGGNFWLKIAATALILTVTSLFLRPPVPGGLAFRPKDLALGLASAVVLWLIFWLAKGVSAWMFPALADQVGAIYAKGQGTPQWLIAILLFLLIGPCEELFWRRYMQAGLMERLGPLKGWLCATGLYTLVHLPSLNIMLMGAAAVAGAFWGLLYWRWGRIPPVIISHAVWTTTAFVVFPIP
ncbi:MAG: CPBP family intramembrane metalloprotease [Desulfarculus sp.]|nr:CPBP family intramembrane metalloprotease [Pseudomonadota bacterium]MBV1716284.1 CPBP family intramembrane metalloprotease [Desulfarculus sp.]MBU4574057.1 CPBP family intramembrane metalloprotease [Pseudomonadota bacterium]MBU4599370.1 CPBP family intramembrane metalloprotease [Pseudomonadota bacterium]MBV1737246.1 CPBP family intramembrane metalloprotease [Desulfarculus sp.]